MAPGDSHGQRFLRAAVPEPAVAQRDWLARKTGTDLHRFRI
jgi:hypothetical protein